MSRISDKIKEVRAYAGVKFTQGRMFIPLDYGLPKTAKESIARQLYEAGIISKDDADKMLGVVYDGDFEVDMEDFDDEAFQSQGEFQQSSLAQYEDFEDVVPEPPKRDDVQPDSPSVPVSDPAQPEPSPATEGEAK